MGRMPGKVKNEWGDTGMKTEESKFHGYVREDAAKKKREKAENKTG